MGCLKLHTVNNTDLKISWVNECVSSAKTEKKARSVYLYGFNTQEKVDEISGSRSHYTAQFWEYDPRIVTRWNRDPVTFPWQSPYAINNNNPIVFTDPLGLFGSRKEAREYKKEHGLKGKIHKGNDGIFSIDDKKGGASYFRDHSLDDVSNVLGRQEDGVIKSVLSITDKASRPSSGTQGSGGANYMAGALVISTGLIADDPTVVGVLDDIAIPFIIGGAYVLDKISAGKGNSSYPGPWTYTYQHPSQNPIHNPPNGFDPKETPPNLGTAAKWLIGGRLVYEMYDEYQQRMNQIGVQPYVVPRDNTNVVHPQFIPYRPR
jgi:hypothetical protein